MKSILKKNGKRSINDTFNNLFEELICFNKISLDEIIKCYEINKNKILCNFPKTIIKKGTILYRVRRKINGQEIDYQNVKEWGPNPNPNRKRNRVNVKGEKALYLSTSSNICAIETKVKHNEEYYLGTYEVKKDIIVPDLYETNINEISENYFLVKFLESILCTMANTKENGQFIKQINKNIKEDKYKSSAAKFSVLPFLLAFQFNTDDELYEITSNLCHTLRIKNNDGIMYRSCYAPENKIYNLALYKNWHKYVNFINAEKLIFSEKIINDYVENFQKTIDILK